MRVLGMFLLPMPAPPPHRVEQRSGNGAALAPLLSKRKRFVLREKLYITLQTPQISQKAMPTSPNERLRVFQRS